jgi:hypothetical protein
MARRQNNREESHNLPRSRKYFKRTENQLNQQLLVILACEGEKTERYYFESFFEILKKSRTLSKLSCVFAPHQHTNPTGVLDDLMRFQDTSGRTYKDYEHRWIVIDRDEERCGGGGHTPQDFNNAISKAKKNRPEVKVAWSNPSFEIWYLLHFHYHNTAIERDAVNIKLSTALSVSYEKNDRAMFSRFNKKMVSDAVRNARRLHDEAKNAGTSPEATNPGTTVYELVELLMVLQNSPCQTTSA